jgi:hypothetical protein
MALVKSENGHVEGEAVDPELVEVMRAAFQEACEAPPQSNETADARTMYSVGDILA